MPGHAEYSFIVLFLYAKKNRWLRLKQMLNQKLMYLPIGGLSKNIYFEPKSR